MRHELVLWLLATRAFIQALVLPLDAAMYGFSLFTFALIFKNVQGGIHGLKRGKIGPACRIPAKIWVTVRTDPCLEILSR